MSSFCQWETGCTRCCPPWHRDLPPRYRSNIGRKLDAPMLPGQRRKDSADLFIKGGFGLWSCLDGFLDRKLRKLRVFHHVSPTNPSSFLGGFRSHPCSLPMLVKIGQDLCRTASRMWRASNCLRGVWFVVKVMVPKMFRRFMVSRGWFDNWLNQWWSLWCQIRSWLVSDAMPIWSWNPQKIHREFHGNSTGIGKVHPCSTGSEPRGWCGRWTISARIDALNEAKWKGKIHRIYMDIHISYIYISYILYVYNIYIYILFEIIYNHGFLSISHSIHRLLCLKHEPFIAIRQVSVQRRLRVLCPLISTALGYCLWILYIHVLLILYIYIYI